MLVTLPDVTLAHFAYEISVIFRNESRNHGKNNGGLVRFSNSSKFDLKKKRSDDGDTMVILHHCSCLLLSLRDSPFIRTTVGGAGERYTFFFCIVWERITSCRVKLLYPSYVVQYRVINCTVVRTREYMCVCVCVWQNSRVVSVVTPPLSPPRRGQSLRSPFRIITFFSLSRARSLLLMGPSNTLTRCLVIVIVGRYMAEYSIDASAREGLVPKAFSLSLALFVHSHAERASIYELIRVWPLANTVAGHGNETINSCREKSPTEIVPFED